LEEVGEAVFATAVFSRCSWGSGARKCVSCYLACENFIFYYNWAPTQNAWLSNENVTEMQHSSTGKKVEMNGERQQVR